MFKKEIFNKNKPPFASNPPMKPVITACHDSMTPAPDVTDTKPPSIADANCGISKI